LSFTILGICEVKLLYSSCMCWSMSIISCMCQIEIWISCLCIIRSGNCISLSFSWLWFVLFSSKLELYCHFFFSGCYFWNFYLLYVYKKKVCFWFSDINPLIGFEPLIFELFTFIFGKGKREKKTLKRLWIWGLVSRREGVKDPTRLRYSVGTFCLIYLVLSYLLIL